VDFLNEHIGRKQLNKIGCGPVHRAIVTDAFDDMLSSDQRLRLDAIDEPELTDILQLHFNSMFNNKIEIRVSEEGLTMVESP
jgi:hypothetical protein